MALTTRDGYFAALAAADRPRIFKSAARTTVANIPFSMFELAGTPGAGTLAGSSTAAGVVPTDATAGCPVIAAFSGANLGYAMRLDVNNTVAARITIYDMLFKAGAYAFNAATTLASQPSYSSRVPGGTDFTATEIWLETVTAFTGLQSIAVTYTDQDGNAAATTGTVATGVAPTIGRMLRLPFATGDTGVQKIESVTSTVATVGTFNVLVLRKIAGARIRVANDQIVQGADLTGLVTLFADSALIMVVTADSTSSGLPEAMLSVGNA